MESLLTLHAELQQDLKNNYSLFHPNLFQNSSQGFGVILEDLLVCSHLFFFLLSETFLQCVCVSEYIFILFLYI